MNRIVITSIIGTAAAAALVVGACAPALASTVQHAPKTTHTLASVQAAAVTTTNKRETALNAAIAKLNAAKGVSASDKVTLSNSLNAGLAGMKAVAVKIAADTTFASAKADFRTIGSTYRIFEVVIPQAHVVAGIADVTSLDIPKLTAAETKLAAALAGKDASKSTAALQSSLADMKAQIAAASTALDGVSAKALTVTPANFEANKTVLHSARASLKSANTDLKKARADRKAIVAALK